MSCAVHAKTKALVVEDEPLIRMSMCDMLDEIGLEAAEAGNGEDALVLLEQDNAISVLVADLGLPGMTGQELLRRARQMRPELKIVVATGRFADEHRDNVGSVFLAKPFDTADLREAIESA
jgi:CheY-like chemotaxis protein